MGAYIETWAEMEAGELYEIVRRNSQDPKPPFWEDLEDHVQEYWERVTDDMRSQITVRVGS